MKRKTILGIAVLALGLGMLGAGCQGASLRGPAWPLTCEKDASDGACALCVKASCCEQATTCGGSPHCECFTNCYADPHPFENPVLACPRKCNAITGDGSFKALRTCVYSHCDAACAGGAS
jgi:hypothetical protein